jgi:hypothetical protein
LYIYAIQSTIMSDYYKHINIALYYETGFCG